MRMRTAKRPSMLCAKCAAKAQHEPAVRATWPGTTPLPQIILQYGKRRRTTTQLQ